MIPIKPDIIIADYSKHLGKRVIIDDNTRKFIARIAFMKTMQNYEPEQIAFCIFYNYIQEPLLSSDKIHRKWDLIEVPVSQIFEYDQIYEKNDV